MDGGGGGGIPGCSRRLSSAAPAGRRADDNIELPAAPGRRQEVAPVSRRPAAASTGHPGVTGGSSVPAAPTRWSAPLGAVGACVVSSSHEYLARAARTVSAGARGVPN